MNIVKGFSSLSKSATKFERCSSISKWKGNSSIFNYSKNNALNSSSKLTFNSNVSSFSQQNIKRSIFNDSRKNRDDLGATTMSATDATTFIEDIYRRQHPKWSETQVAMALMENLEYGFPPELHRPILSRACDILRKASSTDSRSDQILTSALVWKAMLACSNASALEQWNPPPKEDSNSTFSPPFLASPLNNTLLNISNLSNVNTNTKVIQSEWKVGAKTLEEVMEIYDRSLESKKKTLLSDNIQVDILNLMGHIYERLKDSSSQKKLGDRLMDLAKTKNNELITSYAYNNYGLAHRSNRNFEDALKMQRKALRIQKKLLGDRNTEIAKTNELIGHTHCQMDAYGRAVKDYSTAIDITKKIWEPLNGEHHSVASLLDWLGFALAKQQKYTQAVKVKQEQINLLEKIDVYGSRKQIIETKKKELEGLSKLVAQQKKLKPHLKRIRENAISFENSKQETLPNVK
eukprot:TRINITY_DN2293_c0_g1_i1.p1 TRINITY_DN2293_c0_g1~~TRINITY_DN2293_c0_g1_i1.p1  ORF type:complete len:463 (+),score=158.23 TRINITY_DN2293_c0_g1_i1:144-1532(+)